MPDIATVLRNEISRLARKEVRQHVEPLRKSVTAMRRKLSGAQREIDDLQNKVKALEEQAARQLTAPPGSPPKETIRFSPKWVAADRKRLGLSADDYGRLIGVSGQTIRGWESGKTRPQPERLTAWAALRGIGKREARRRLGLLKRIDEKTTESKS